MPPPKGNQIATTKRESPQPGKLPRPKVRLINAPPTKSAISQCSPTKTQERHDQNPQPEIFYCHNQSNIHAPKSFLPTPIQISIATKHITAPQSVRTHFVQYLTPKEWLAFMRSAD